MTKRIIKEPKPLQPKEKKFSCKIRWKLEPHETITRNCLVAVLTYQEVAKILGISTQRVHQLEHSAFWKLRRNPVLKQYWKDITKG